LERRVVRVLARPDHGYPDNVRLIGGIDNPEEALLVALEKLAGAKEVVHQVVPLPGLRSVLCVDSVFHDSLA
jgi:hypothetical protein